MKKLKINFTTTFECDMGELGKEIYAQVVNSKLPQEIKDSWLHVCVEENIEKLY